ncbi:SMI1/KNR4 family protein [Variovorax sp. E3]|uniref:SMI1/KNR4 family protein n=1 Tax=Variovorax sp. E3 TaxID=1914993 RepID=UPI0018DC73E5|nr:SMI1/KNR4 family protein [Variovorax sp. E3]
MDHPLTHRIARIRSELDRLKAADLKTTIVDLGDREVVGYRCRIHGAAVHRYELVAPVNPDALATFENHLGTRLPPEYREWITQVSDGGAGPMLGVFPLAKEAEDAAVDHAADFPFTAAHPCAPAPEDSDEEWSSDIGKIHRGVTFLANEGDGMYNLLVLRGPAAGQVWWHSYEHASATPILHPGTRAPLTFLDWYELWLERALDPNLEQVASFGEFV